jgi:hypothetical protein
LGGAMDKQSKMNREIAHHIFSGSTTMIGVCITVITLFLIIKNRYTTYADGILAIDAFFFIISAFISYLSLRRNNNRKLELFADIFFFTGMLIMVIVGIMIVYIEA